MKAGCAGGSTSPDISHSVQIMKMKLHTIESRRNFAVGERLNVAKNQLLLNERHSKVIRKRRGGSSVLQAVCRLVGTAK